MRSRGHLEPEASVVLGLASGNEKLLEGPSCSIADSERVYELARKHEVASLCSWMWDHHFRSRFGEGDSPPWFDRTKFRAEFLHHSLRNEWLLRNVRELSEAFNCRGIQVLFLKGIGIALLASPDPGVRPIGDIDLLIRDRDYADVLDALKEVGYAPDLPVPGRSEDAIKVAHYRRQLRFVAPEKRPVEVHFRLENCGPPTLAEEWVWETRRSVGLWEGSTVWIPGPEAMLFHSLLHANQHGFAVLRLLFDIRWTLDRWGVELDRSLFDEQIRRARCASSAYHSLLLAQSLASASVDPQLLDHLRPSPGRRWWFSMVWGVDAVRRLQRPRRAQWLEAPLFFLLELGTLRRKLVYLANVLWRCRRSRSPSGVAPERFAKSEPARS